MPLHRTLLARKAPGLSWAASVSSALATSSAPISSVTPKASSSKKGGNISDSFASLSATSPGPLPSRFRDLKCSLIAGYEAAVQKSWTRLLQQLGQQNEKIAAQGSAIIPQIDFKELAQGGLQRIRQEVRKRGAVVVRGVVDEKEARGYKTEVEEYIRENPTTKAFPQHDPQVYELYWSSAQLRARSHPAMLATQQHLMSDLWTVKDASTSLISLNHPVTYADRLRIRQPGDTAFALGPHVDGGSVERWEKEGYGRGQVYDAVFRGGWEADFDPWDATGRIDAVADLYDGSGACSMFRMWQGWLSMSNCGPAEGTLLVYPLVKLAMAYLLLRPFFRPLDENRLQPGFLEPLNWVLCGEDDMTSALQGAWPGFGQELNNELHPHLELERTMIHMPRIHPGDFVAWHCDAHRGIEDASVLYIPACPLTEINARYLSRQLVEFRSGTPSPDFPGGEGESHHLGRPREADLRRISGKEGRRAMGVERWVADEAQAKGARETIRQANVILGL